MFSLLCWRIKKNVLFSYWFHPPCWRHRCDKCMKKKTMSVLSQRFPRSVESRHTYAKKSLLAFVVFLFFPVSNHIHSLDPIHLEPCKVEKRNKIKHFQIVFLLFCSEFVHLNICVCVIWQTFQYPLIIFIFESWVVGNWTCLLSLYILHVHPPATLVGTQTQSCLIKWPTSYLLKGFFCFTVKRQIDK